MKRPGFLILIIVLASAFAFGQKKSTENLILFEVDSKPVTVGEFIYLYNKNNQGRADEFTKEKIDEYINLLINFKLKVREAEARGLDVSPEFIKELNGYKEELKKPFVAEVDVLQKLTQEAYERLGEEIKASHILINVGPEAEPADTLAAYKLADDLRSRSIKGEDFEKLAREFSEDPSVKMNGGNLGYFSALQMVFPFEEAAFNLEVGEVSKPVRTRFGYHVIKVNDRRPSSGEVEVSHILVRGADDEAKNLISKVYDELQKNGSWDTLCAKYSQDQGTRESGGRLRPFGLGALASAPKFEEVAFSLNEVGVISEPVQTSFGWHIIRLERKIPLPPFAELKTSLERRIARDERMAISKTLVAEKRKSKFNYKANASMTKNLKLLSDSSIVKGNWNLNKTNIKETEVLFSIGETDLTVREFANYIIGNQSSSNGSPNSYIQELYDQFVDEQLAAMEDTQLQNANPEYRKMVKEYREGILLFSIMEKEVWNKASEDSLGQRKYYNEHADKYASGLRLEARIFSTEDQSFRDEIKGKIQKGDTLSQGDTKKFKSILNFRAYERGDNKIIDLINWTVGLHEVENEGMYYLVEASKLVSPGLKKFSEVRASVISDYQDYLEKAWLKDLKEKYPAKVNSKGRKKAIEELTSKSKS